MKKPPNCGTTYCSCIECIMEDDDDEDEICSWCSGSGEGMHDGSTCGKCHGTGIEPAEKDEDDCYDID